MQLYDPKFVHFEWSDKLDVQYCFVADNIDSLISKVNTNDTCQFLKVSKSDNESCPFNYKYKNEISGTSRFAYYDPNYNVKYAYFIQHKDIYVTLRNSNIDWVKIEKGETFLDYIDDPDYEFKIIDDFTELREAYKQGKTIQHMNLDGDWVDCDMPVSFVANHSYRVKPEEKKAREWENGELEYMVSVQVEFHNGNTIYYRNKTFDNAMWHPFSKATACKDYCVDFKTYEYKVNPEEIINKGATLNISDKGFGELEDTLYRPFKDTNELIEYWDKHYSNGNRPEYTMPLIWVKGKERGNIYLITGYEEDKYIYIGDDWFLSMEELFEQCRFLDGKFCGKVKE